jgi:two-component system heavy metal sensor histidine kinase CusS
VALGCAALAFATAVVASLSEYQHLESSLAEAAGDLIKEKLTVCQKLIAEQPGNEGELREEVEWAWSSNRYERVLVRIFDPVGRRVVAQTPGAEAAPFSLAPVSIVQGVVDPGKPVEVRSAAGKPWLVLSVRNYFPSARKAYVLEGALDRTREAELLASFRRRLTITVILILAAGLPFGYSIARRSLAPVESISQTMRAIGMSTLHQRLKPEELPVELQSLSRTFNEMLDRLEGSFTRISRFSENMAHEICTPLSNMRGELEVALSRPRDLDQYKQVLTSSLEECTRLAEIVERLLFLARADNPELGVKREPTKLRSELDKVFEFYEAVAGERGVTVTVVPGEDVTVLADPELLQRAVANLVSNALAHTPAGGTVRLAVTRTADEGIVRVTDTGDGIPAEHLPHVFDRFHRVDAARSSKEGGAGLGLAIVASIATIHGGKTMVESEVGRGTTVSLTIPRVTTLA